MSKIPTAWNTYAPGATTKRVDDLERTIRQVMRMKQLERIRGNRLKEALQEIISECAPANEFDASIIKIAKTALADLVVRGLVDPMRPLSGDPQLVLAERIVRLEADLMECQEYLERNYLDVIDGDDGRPAPNEAMRLVSMIRETLDA